MTQNQLKYMELMLTKDRDAWNAEVARRTIAETERHNQAYEMETGRHNRETEAQALRELTLGWYNASSGRITALANQRNAESNARNAATNERNARTNERNADVNWYNAQSNRINAYSNRMQAQAAQDMVGVSMYNADTQRLSTRYSYELGLRNAAVAERNAASNESQAKAALQQSRVATARQKSDAALNTIRGEQFQAEAWLSLAELDRRDKRDLLLDREIQRTYAQAMQAMANAGLTGQEADMYDVNNAIKQTGGLLGSISGFLSGYGSLLRGANSKR